MSQQKGLRILYVANVAIVIVFAAIASYTYVEGRGSAAILWIAVGLAATIVVHTIGRARYGLRYFDYLGNPSRSSDLVFGMLGLAMAGASFWTIFLGKPIAGITGCLFFGLGGMYILLRKPEHRNLL